MATHALRAGMDGFSAFRHAHRPAWLRAAILLLLCGLVALAASSDALHGPVMRFVGVAERVIAENPVAGAVLFVCLAALSGMLAFFSSAVIVPVGVHAWGPVRCAVLLWIGWLLGGVATYAIGRWLGRPVVERLAQKRVLARYEKKIRRDMPLALVALFQLALPSEVPGYLLGLVRYSFFKYLAVLAFAELVWAIGTVMLGDSFVHRHVLPFVAVGVAAALLSGWAYVRLHRRLETQGEHTRSKDR